ncbi:MAG: SUF system NifU family Fe-S cluster assembly protein [Myxococcales bacterium]|nr:SUF system NifU family Fe-S cluster assembly protein [Myxococcales bacterium]MCB9708026.1 SUF system NifU family Fe-S cluster assembly protein [Myxococcales bacterium]
MSDLRELYQEVILDHSKAPRNFRFPDPASHSAEGHNPLCGDHLILKLRVNDSAIEDIGFQGSGCAISTAAASTMTELVKGKTIHDTTQLYEKFHGLVIDGQVGDLESLGKLAVFSGLSEFPTRVKCATLAWHTLRAALNNPGLAVSTE